MEYFQQSKPILGWHWAGPLKISQSLLVNQFDGHRNWESYGYTIDDFLEGYHLIIKPDEYSHGVGPEILNARAIQFEPTLRLDPSNPNKLVIREGDTTRPVFGFSYIRGFIPTNPSDPNFNRLIIHRDSTHLVGQVILDNPWPPHQFTRQGWNYPKGDTAQKVRDSFLLDKMYLSINLRRSSFGYSGDTILKIELPYTVKGGVGGDLRFATIPSNTITDTLELQRGCYRKDENAPNNDTKEIYVTKNMIPPGNKDITISALLLFNNELDSNKYGNEQLNRRHPNEEGCENGYIDSIGIRVTYMSDNPVMIDWIRLESPHAREFLKGTFDSLLTAKVQQDLYKYISTEYSSRGIKLFRYNTIIEGGSFNWLAEKYFNKLIGNIGTSEVGVFYPAHYEHYVNPPDRWLGLFQIAPNVSVPYSRRTYIKNDTTNARTLGLVNGFNGWDKTTPSESSYETFLRHSSTSLPISFYLDNEDMTMYRKSTSYGENGWLISSLANWEGYLYNGFLKQNKQGFLFSDKLWWSQSFPLMDFVDKPLGAHYGNTRPYTAEELRLSCYTPLILGCKGLLYDGPYTLSNTTSFMRLYDGGALSETVRDSLESLSDMEFLSSIDAGGDWVREGNEILNLNNRFLLLDSVAKYLERPKDKIYLGRLSNRLELRKVHEFIKKNEETIMNLRLQAWWAKGYKKWYMQDTSLNYNVISKFIDTNGIRTKEVYSTEPEGSESYNFIDSSFYDITILKYDTLSLNDVFYMGTVNRRTSPLILENDTLRFYSGAEFDNFMDFGGTSLTGEFKPTDYWQDLYWKRLGCREITIPTNIIDPSKNIYYKIEELAYNEDYSESLPFWKKEQIRNRVKITIPQGQSFATKYLPGSGRMFRINIIHDTTKPFLGELAFSNQTKIIAYPACDSSKNSDHDFWKDTTTQELNFYKDSLLYYHIVYDRPNPLNDRSRVYYRRSAIPYDRTINTKIIQWGPEILLSDTIIFRNGIHVYHPDPYKDTVQGIAGSSISCKYPSIVVRYDDTTDIVKVYVVFSCNLPHLSSHPDSCRIFMVESVFPHDTLFVPPSLKAPNYLEPIAWGRVRSIEPTELDKYGGVSINASYNGNYYTFCDTAFGIGVGFKTTNDRGFITNRKYIKFDQSGLCSQPSLNTYSRLNINEDNCALVFKEYSEGQDRIIYTRLRNPSGQIENYVPLNFCDTNPIHRMCWYGWDNSTAIINFFDVPEVKFKAEYPVVYRPVDFARRPSFEVADSLHYIDACWDRVYWHSNVGEPTAKRSIFMKNIDIDDTQNCWYMLPELQLFMPENNLAQPSPGPGAPSSNTTGTFHDLVLSDSSYILNFIKYPLLDTPSVNSHVYQINMNGWLNYFERWTGPIEDWSVNLQWWASVGQGMYPHTTHTPVITENRDWYIHNRIYQTENNAIRTSAILFLKGAQDQKTIYPLLSLSDENSKSQISEIFTLGNSIESRYTSIGLKAFSKDENGRIKRADTIVSNWFRIDAIKELAFYSILSDTTLFSFELEDNSGKSLKLPMSSDRSSSLNSRKITFLNGKNKEYRIKLTKKNKDVNVWLDLLFDDKRDLSEEVSDYSSKELRKSNLEFEPKHQVYDLSDHEIISGEMINLKTYPNPAGDYIYVSCELITKQNSAVLYTLFNATGIKVFETTSKESITIIHTGQLQSGVYFLKAEPLEFDLNSEFKPFTTKSIVINR